MYVNMSNYHTKVTLMGVKVATNFPIKVCLTVFSLYFYRVVKETCLIVKVLHVLTASTFINPTQDSLNTPKD